ncbi:asparagine synthase-related protein [Novosphingobium terrae]|uniref:asparagine synthase-related protein n=1 Tax=Novosphingobium terrae TaxID=2726189 RepID=UPI00197F9985|nr:asparagine synthase-related protein [Novosphingobium terrae]
MAGAFLAQIALSAIMPFQVVTRPPEFDCIIDEAWFRLLVKRGTPIQISQYGVILGELFRRDEKVAANEIASHEWEAIVATGGRALTEKFWGNYVAFLRRPVLDGKATIDVVRAPLGQLGCYWCVAKQKLILASEPELIVQTGLMRLHIAPAALTRHIAAPEIALEQTCLADVRSLTGGSRISSGSDRPEIDLLWSPWNFCRDDSTIRNHEIAGARLRRVFTQCIGAQMDALPKALLLLSGGLDSSILAACLHIAGHPFHALNLVTKAATGDERDYARIAAQATGAKLTEALRNAGEVDLLASRAARCARPHTRAFTQSTRDHAARCAIDHDAGVVLDGGGGDNLFFGYPTLAALVEILKRRGPGFRFWQTSAALAEQADTGLGSVVMQTIHRAVTRDNRLRFDQRDQFLSARSRSALKDAAPHPWREPPKHIGAGKAAHVALLVPVQATAEQATRACGDAPWFSPFMCQPAVEAVLTIPIWAWFAPGLNRAAARLGFKGDLPPALIQRRTKGTPNSYVNDLFEQHRPAIRAMLLDGLLTAMGVLDADSVRAALDDPMPARDLQFARIMELVDAEAWARSWE